MPSLLVIDRLEETRTVLATVLHRRGVQVHATSRADDAICLALKHRPQVCIVDEDAVRDADPEFFRTLDAATRQAAAHLLWLGDRTHAPGSLSACEFVAKPYDYRTLIRRIEELLPIRQPLSRAA